MFEHLVLEMHDDSGQAGAFQHQDSGQMQLDTLCVLQSFGVQGSLELDLVSKEMANIDSR